MKRVLVACEFSGVVRDAFAAVGWDAWSCDLLPSEKPGNHFQGDAIEFMDSQNWDLLIAHPPYTYLSYAATAHWNKPGRAEKRSAALDFFMAFINAPIPRICVENPVGWANVVYRKPDQIIHPYYFGDKHLKRTCLWLKGLPTLWWWPVADLFGERTATDYPEPIYEHKRLPSKNFVGGETKKRYFTDTTPTAHGRSKSFHGIARAMAEQWGGL